MSCLGFELLKPRFEAVGAGGSVGARVFEHLRDEDAALLHRATGDPQRALSIRVEADESLMIDADEQLLLSAMSNLVQNALKFTRTGGSIVLRSRLEGSHALLEVEDECGGLPPGKQEELFQPYVQRGADRRGLGLAITRQAIELQGGEVYVRNLPGKGCVFGIRLRAPAN